MSAVEQWIEDGVRTWAFEKARDWYIAERISVGDDVYTRPWDESDGEPWFQGKSDGESHGFSEFRGRLEGVRDIELVYMGSRRWRAIEVPS